MEAAVVARSLVKRYGAFEAVRGVEFAAPVRECFGFLGPNGAGKTSTMRMISCALPPSAGELSVLGMDVRAHPRAIKKRMGVVPQENNLDEELSVIDNLIVYARFFGIRRDVSEPRARELLDFMQLSEKRTQKIMALSGGMKRRLLIARALMNEPEVLILDEPTTGLDPQARHLVWEKLRTLRREGVTLILTSHYMDEAAQLCDRLVIMHDGKILVEGPPRGLVADHTTKQVIEVFEPPPELLAGLEEVARKAERVEKLADRWLVYTNDGDQMFGAIRSVGLDPGSVWLRGGTLEDVFLSLTGRSLIE